MEERGPRDPGEETRDPRTADASSGPVHPPRPGEPMVERPGALAREMVQRVVGDRFDVERIAGAGGMGHVFAATDTVLQRRVAIKLLHGGDTRAGDRSSDPRERARILKEARAMAGLRHPHLCPVHELSITGPVPFIVMDWIDGLDLATAWQRWDRNQRLSLFVKVVEAVAALHGAGIVHGDLKPANILVDRAGEPIIVDFGLASSRGESGDQSRLVGGTPGYAALEQFEEGQPITPATDVYALGVLLYELLTDRRPFHADGVDELLEAMKEHDPPLPEVFTPDAPWPLQRICLVALERRPEHRYRDAHALRQDVDRFLRGETVAARPSMLTDRFVETVERQLDQVGSWHRQGLITGGEADRLQRLLAGILRPESHWILDSRRLSVSQVTLYLGGWLALAALTIGMVFTAVPDDVLESAPSLRYVTACVVAAVLLGTGIWLQRRGERRVSLGYLVTAGLAVPVACWLLLRERGWWSTPMQRVAEGASAAAHEPEGPLAESQEWITVLARAPVETAEGLGLVNRQVLVITLTWLGTALLLRRLAASSAFTLFAVLAAGLAAVAAWASAGMMIDDRTSFARLGLWMTIVGLAAFWPGLRLNQREEAFVLRSGPARMRTHDSWPVLSGALLMIAVGLTLAAWNAADVYTLGLVGSSHDDPSARAVAFIVNGVVLQALSHALARRRTVVRTRLAEAIRWVSPSHFLLALYVLFWDARLDERDAHKWMWLALMTASAIGLCYISVWQQWRPFLLTGLAYIAVGYATTYPEVIADLDEDHALRDTVRLLLGAGVLVIGVATMVLAWKLPGGGKGARVGCWWRETRNTTAPP